MKKKKHVTMEELEKWVNALSNHDRNNFWVLISLPTVEEVIAKMPEGLYKEMSLTALALKILSERK